MSRPAISLILCACIIFAALPVRGGDIHRAIEENDVERVREILESNPASLNEQDESNRFKNLPIHTAANTGNVEIMRLLLDAGADIDAGDSDNSTALGNAAMLRHKELVTFLIERGANLTHRDRKGDTPVSFAVYGKDESIILQMIDAGGDIYYVSPTGLTLLHLAVSRDLPETVRYILDRDAYMINAKERSGMTACTFAAWSGKTEILRLLLDNGADPDCTDPEALSPLLATCWGNHIDCAALLLERGADVNVVRSDGRTPIMHAAEACSNDMVELLLENGADVNSKSEYGETALVEAAAKGYSDRVATLLAAKADPDLGTDMDGRTALHLASLGGYPGVAKQLIEAGAKSDAETPHGETALELACYYGQTDVCKVLSAKAASAGFPKVPDRSPAGMDGLKNGEASIWFLGHSGWAVKTRNHLLVFDYYTQGEPSSTPGLCNGTVVPTEFTGSEVAVFASHYHGDHYSPAIFEWRDQAGDITYFLGLQPRDSVPSYEYMEGRMEKKYGDMKLTTIPATDAGVAMVVEVDGVTIFHAGDHANGRTGLMSGFTDEIDFLAGNGIRPDICFMGIRGCSLGDPVQVREGIIYTLEKLEPKVFFPMHARAEGGAYSEFIEGIEGQLGSIRMAAPENRGDSFIYRRGKLEDPREEMKSRLLAGSKDGSCKEEKKEACAEN